VVTGLILEHVGRLGRPGSFRASGAAVLLACVGVAMTVGVAASAPAPVPSFAEPKEYATGPGPDALVSGDLNGDGKLDLVTANSKAISVLLNRGDGTFQQRRDYRAGGMRLVIGDLNGDRRLDLATTSALLSGHVSVLLNRGDGSFRAKRDYRTGRGPKSLAIGDLNGDRKLDLATANMYQPANSKAYTVSVLLNRGGGRFRAPRDYRTADNPEAIAIGDVNGDGELDLVTANDGNSVSVLFNRGGGRFRAKRDHRTGPSPTDIAIGDLNADGKPDLVTPNLNSIDTGPPRISVLLNNGNGRFRARRDYDTGWIYSVEIGDLNSDRKPDLVVGSIAGFPSVLLNRGNGSFQAMLEYRVQTKLKYNSAGGEWAAIGDFNGDGKVDLATSNSDDSTVSVLINTPGLCNVQEVRRMTLAAAARTLGRVNCGVREVGRDYSGAFKRGLVMRQKPASGAVLPNAGKVDLVVSLGPKQ
jgi:FG-GAP-like repeat